MTTYKNSRTGVVISEAIYNKLPFSKRNRYSRTYRAEPVSTPALIIDDIDDDSIFIDLDLDFGTSNSSDQFGGFGGGDFGGGGAGGSYDDSSSDSSCGCDSCGSDD